MQSYRALALCALLALAAAPALTAAAGGASANGLEGVKHAAGADPQQQQAAGAPAQQQRTQQQPAAGGAGNQAIQPASFVGHDALLADGYAAEPEVFFHRRGDGGALAEGLPGGPAQQASLAVENSGADSNVAASSVAAHVESVQYVQPDVEVAAKAAKAERLAKYFEPDAPAEPQAAAAEEITVSSYARPTSARYNKALKKAAIEAMKPPAAAAAKKAPDSTSTAITLDAEGQLMDADDDATEVYYVPASGGSPGAHRAHKAHSYKTITGMTPPHYQGAAYSDDASMATYPNSMSHTQARAAFYDDLDPMAYWDPNNNGQGTALRRKEARNVYNFQARRQSFTVGTTGAVTAPRMVNGRQTSTTTTPVLIWYKTDFTCGVQNAPSRVGDCVASIVAESATATDGIISVTCTLQEDASNICGARYVQGMVITAQGPVTLKGIDTATPSITGKMLPITGVYMPNRRTTLLADVVTILSGVKGGMLMLDTTVGADGFLTFYFWR